LLAVVTIIFFFGYGPRHAGHGFRRFCVHYYFAGVFRVRLASLIIQLHGAVFSSWILLVSQTSLASAGRVDIHRRLGIAGFLLACLMVVRRFGGHPFASPGRWPNCGCEVFYIIRPTDMFAFATPVIFASLPLEPRDA